MKNKLLWPMFYLQIMFLNCDAAETCSAQNGGVLIRMQLRSRVNATNYRIFTARVDSQSKVNTDQLAVDLSQSETFLENNINLITFEVVAAVPTIRKLSTGYEYFPDFGHYKLYTSVLTWPEAKKVCEDDNAHLMVIETAAEAEVVKALFARKPVFPGTTDAKYVSIGVNDIEKEGHYVTITGKDLNSLEYKTLHIYHGSDGRAENYVCADAKGEMHDFPNTWKLGFICEAY